jgi:hypothetical protein
MDIGRDLPLLYQIQFESDRFSYFRENLHLYGTLCREDAYFKKDTKFSNFKVLESRAYGTVWTQWGSNPLPRHCK